MNRRANKVKELCKPCPFCDSGETRCENDGFSYFVRCGGCKAQGPQTLYDMSAIHYWNEALREGE